MAYNSTNSESQQPRLVVPSAASKDQREYIRYKIYNADKGRIVVAKDYSVNNVPKAQKANYVKVRIRQIKDLIQAGHVKSRIMVAGIKELERIKRVADSITMTDAIKLGLKEKQNRKLRNIGHLEVRSKVFINWLKATNRHRMMAATFGIDNVKSFKSYLRNTRKVAARTINNYITDLSAIISEVVENGYLSRNIFKEIGKEVTGTGRNWAFTKEQINEQLKFMARNQPDLLLLVQFMYFTLARPNELSHMKVGDIGRRYSHQIWFPESVTKEIQERNVMIPTQLQTIIEKAALKSYPADWFVFSNDFKPGPSRYNPKWWGNRFRYAVLNKLGGYDLNHTLYSWKHTGVVSLFNAGIDVNSIRRQLGHRSHVSFEKYLKSLGLYKNDAIINEFPDLP